MTPLLRLAAGAGAGIVGMSATYPLDMVRGRLTVQGERKTSQYRGIWDCTRQIVKQARPCVHRTSTTFAWEGSRAQWSDVPLPLTTPWGTLSFARPRN